MSFFQCVSSAAAGLVVGEWGWSILIAVVALAALLQKRVNVPEPAVVAVAAVVGRIAFS